MEHESVRSDERADEPRVRRIRALLRRPTRPGRRTPARVAAHTAGCTTRFDYGRAGAVELGGWSRPEYAIRAIESRQAGGSSARSANKRILRFINASGRVFVIAAIAMLTGCASHRYVSLQDDSGDVIMEDTKTGRTWIRAIRAPRTDIQ